MIPHALFTQLPAPNERIEGGSTRGWSGTNLRQELGKLQLHKYLFILMYAQTQTSTINGRISHVPCCSYNPAEKKEGGERPDA